MITCLQLNKIAGCEVQRDCCFVPHEQKFLQLVALGMAKNGIAANNMTGRMKHHDQIGGTAIATLG